MVLAYYQKDISSTNIGKVTGREREREEVKIQSKGNDTTYLILNSCIFIPSPTVSMKLNDEMHQKSTLLVK